MNKNSLSKMTLILALMFAAMFPLALIAAPLEGENESAESVDRMQMRLKMLEHYLKVVESVHSIADDPEKSVVLQLQQLEDMYRKQRNPQKIISMYQDILKNTSNQTVRNAASIKLAHLLQRAGRDSEAEELTRKSLDENLKRLK
jgi:tetratricopeptide (TPR) repeat protein